MFPSWDKDSLEDVLAATNGNSEKAIDMLLQWSCDADDAQAPAPASAEASSACPRPVVDPVSPWHGEAGDESAQLFPSAAAAGAVPEPLDRGAYDKIIARRLDRKSGTRQLAGVLKVAAIWHHRAHLHQAGKHPNLPSPTAQEIDMKAELAKLSREESIVAGKELLRERCLFLGMKQHEMEDDGNCQFRALSQELYGSQRHHDIVRAQVVSYLQKNEAEYKAFFDDAEWAHYLENIGQLKTWGDELSLRAAAEAFAIKVHVITSTEENWLLEYAPADSSVIVAREVFLTYVAPIHYNTIEPLR